ncbi:Methylmalonate-semialdehyde dehydrogenase [Aspergillus candidus]|uniref:methylmalonate-semialdehyde dehydrogenase (CoA acylating) n=1 Tax=Aspergillus candidus TaxID=41067 RepID=A0A2I2F663_ASPCN|nr:Methylmalonate-semialdehyde dehydrogenase [Aspergillus candidus]PLB36134.1 Methylmalonate-semialdehyde dehydrogenase [Aspergillus candidus]
MPPTARVSRRVRFTPFPQVAYLGGNDSDLSGSTPSHGTGEIGIATPGVISSSPLQDFQQSPVSQCSPTFTLSESGSNGSPGSSNTSTPGSGTGSVSISTTETRPTVTHLFINNQRVMSKSKHWTSILDPGTQRLLSRVPSSTHDEVQTAVHAAETAQDAWAARGFQSRREYLLDWIDVLREMTPDIVACLCREVGKTLADANTEVFRGLDCIHAACSIGTEMAGMYLGSDPTILQTFYEPVGVCVTIAPFSYPFMIPLWSLPYALITGNTVILKPSEKAPSLSTLLADAVIRTGFPPGIFNILHGDRTTVRTLIPNPSVQAISFVGSETAAREVHDLARTAGKRIQAECGGKNHGVVLDDASMMPTLYAIAGSAFGATGQRCMALSVAIFVGGTREWIPKLVDLAQSMVVGMGGDEDTKLGPLISRDAKERVVGVIDRAVDEGAMVLLDGRDVSVPRFPEGNFLGPTILMGVETYMECYQTEIFGPVLICMQVDTLDEAIDLINQNRYGNGCSIFTTSGKQAKTFQRRVNVGQIGINIPLIAPYGPAVRTSNKDSFLGDRHAPGKTYWPFFTTVKTVSARWDQ